MGEKDGGREGVKGEEMGRGEKGRGGGRGVRERGVGEERERKEEEG